MCGIHASPSLLRPTWITFLFSFATFFRANPRLVLVLFFSFFFRTFGTDRRLVRLFFFPFLNCQKERTLAADDLVPASMAGTPFLLQTTHLQNCTPPHPASNTNTVVLTRGCNGLQEGQRCRSESVCCRFTTMKRLSRSKISRMPNQNCREFTGFCSLCQRNSNYQYTSQRTAMCICLIWDPVRL